MTQPEMTTAAADPDQVLIDFGFHHESDGALVSYRNGLPRERWEPDASGGFKRYERVEGAWQPVPYTIAAAFAGVNGLDHTSQPQAYEYVYPADYVRNIYAVALAERVANAGLG